MLQGIQTLWLWMWGLQGKISTWASELLSVKSYFISAYMFVNSQLP